MTTHKRRPTYIETFRLAILSATIAAPILVLAGCAGGQTPALTQELAAASSTPVRTVEPEPTATRPPTDTPTGAPIRTPAGAPIPTPPNTPTIPPTGTPTTAPPCTVRQDWYVHTVVRGDTLYAFQMKWPEDGKALIRSLAPYRGVAVANVELLGHDGKLDWTQSDRGLDITLPAAKTSEYAHCFRIQTK